MRLELFLAADYANITGDGKLNVMGIFRVINATNFPARHASMHLVIRMIPELGEYGVTRDLKVILREPDGNELVELSGQIEAPERSGELSPEVNVILELKDLIYPQPGPYQFIVLVDKDYKGSLQVMLNKIDPSVLNQG